MKARYRFLGRDVEISPLSRTQTPVLEIDGVPAELTRSEYEGRLHRVRIDGCDYEGLVARDGDSFFVQMEGDVWHVEAINAVDAAGGRRGSTDALLAPMPGVVISTAASVGDTVSEGQTLMVIESMKLQTSIVAEREGVVAEVFFKAEETFDKGTKLIRFEARADDDGVGHA